MGQIIEKEMKNQEVNEELGSKNMQNLDMNS